MPDKTPADRTVTAPSDAAPRTADAHSMDALTKRIGGLLQRRAWYQLPRLLAYARLVEIRNQLREKNLHDTEEPPLEKRRCRRGRSRSGDPRSAHAPTGPTTTCIPARWAAVGRRFGRNVPLEHTFPDTANLIVPNPRVGQPRADDPRRSSSRRRSSTCSRPRGFSSWCTTGSCTNDRRPSSSIFRCARRRLVGAPSIRVPRSVPEPAPAGSTRPPAYANLNSHWWDGSQIYGCDREMAAKLRTRTRAASCRSSRPSCCRSIPTPACTSGGFTDNWWIGLAMLHTLFTLEHNHICDLLAHEHPRLDRRAALPQGQADQLRADGEDPHRRVDAGDRAAPDHRNAR